MVNITLGKHQHVSTVTVGMLALPTLAFSTKRHRAADTAVDFQSCYIIDTE